MRYIDSGLREATQALGSWLDDTICRDDSVCELRWQTGFFDAGSLGYFASTMARLRSSDSTLNVLVGSNDGMTKREDIEALIEAAGPPRENQRLGIVKFGKGYFHPKTVHIVREDGSSAAYIGSANLTRNGVTAQHVEAGIILDSRERDDEGVLSEIAAAIDIWFAEPRRGLHLVSDSTQLEKLVSKGVIGVPIPSPPAQQGSRLTQLLGRQLAPLVGAPTLPSIAAPQPTQIPSIPPITASRPTLRVSSPSTPVAPSPPKRSPSTSVVEDSWWKQLTRSDAQRKAQGNQRGSITLTQGGRYIDAQTYFRRSLFKNATWVAEKTRTGQRREAATIPFKVTFLGEDLGVRNVEITYAPNREAAQANYTSLLHLSGRLAAEFSAQNVTGKYLELSRISDGYTLSITDDVPGT
ncbi:hypothetical protein ABIF63_000048 [Bradyrhizobium japonicum]|uniref:Restriction endonuclease type II NgoFVII N-terminal domain-containing protein n=1 Tax=Bradyrhizobium japonicum TaxID=375 RepID=A0ABV2RI06_BRAJP